MINQYREITSYDGTKFEDFLNRLNLISIFGELLKVYPVEVAQGIVKYILWAYSIESDELSTVKEEWGKIRDRIYKKQS